MSAFLLNVLFARSFSAAASGQVFYLFTIFAFIIQFSSLSLESGIGFYAARKEMDHRQLLGLSVAWSFLSSSVIIILFVPVATLFSFPVNFPLYYPAVFILGNMLISFGNTYAYSNYFFALPGLIAFAINLLLIIVLVFAEHAGIKNIFIPIYFLSFGVHGTLLFAWLIGTNAGMPSFAFARPALKKIFRYSIHAYAGNLLFLLMNRIDYVFVKKYCDAAALGNYIQVSKIAQLFFLLPSMLATVIFPLIAGGLKNEVADRVRTLSVMILATYFILLTFLVLVGHSLFPWMFGAAFTAMYLPFVLLVPGILAISCLYPYTAYYAGVNRIRVNVSGSMLALALMVAGDVLFIPRYGIKAAALVSSGAYLIFLGYVMAAFRKEFRLPLKKLFTLNTKEYLYIIQRFK